MKGDRVRRMYEDSLTWIQNLTWKAFILCLRLNYSELLFLFVAVSLGKQGLSFLTKDGTCAPCSGSRVLTTESCSVMSDSLWLHGLYSPWNSLCQNTGVGSLSLLQGVFPTQGSNPGLPHCWQILYQLRHKGSPRILEWVAYPFSSRSSWPRNQTGVSCTAGGFFTNGLWGKAHPIREVPWERIFNVIALSPSNCTS